MKKKNKTKSEFKKMKQKYGNIAGVKREIG